MLQSLRTITVSVPLVAPGFGTDERLTVAAVNQRAGAALAVQLLVSLGHTSIAHVSGPPGWMDAAARTEGRRRALEQAGLPEAGYFVPPPTTVNQGFKELGEHCTRMLLSDMENGPSGAASVLNPRLVVRGSTAPPAERR